jgi:glycosyltransferase involved in cell wall biosynthesis
MKILFLSAWYPNKYDPMPGLFVKQHAEAVSSDHEVAVLYTHAGDDRNWSIDQRSIENIQTTIVYYPKNNNILLRSNPFWKGFQFLYAHYIGYRKIKKTFGKPQLVHVNILTRCGVVAWLLKISRNIPYVITEHWSRYLPIRQNYNGFFRKFLTRIVLKNSLGICTVSDALRQAMIQNGIRHKNFQVIPNSVDTSVFIPAQSAVNDPIKTIGHISCFDEAAKNISGILQTIARLKEKRTDFRLLLIGEGPDKMKIEALSQTLELTNKYVFFSGLLEGKQLVEAYQNSYFTLLFSNYENMPVVIAESFACGVPVVATRVGGIPEVINDRNGLLVHSNNEQELLAAIEFMLDHASGFDKNYIRNFAKEKFGKEAFIKLYNQFYNHLLSGINLYNI